MIRDAKKELKALKKEMKYFAKEYSKNDDDNIYEYMLIINARYKHIKEGAKGSRR